MMHKQRGVTALGWMSILAVIAVFALAAVRLVPVYLENLKVKSSLNSVQKEFDGQAPSVQTLQRALGKRFDIESVRIIEVRDIHIEREGEAYRLTAAYDHSTPFISNVSFTVSFEDSVEVRR